MPENSEELFRELLNKQDLTTLDNLALKSKKEILLFWLKEKQTLKSDEKENQNIEINIQSKELEKID